MKTSLHLSELRRIFDQLLEHFAIFCSLPKYLEAALKHSAFHTVHKALRDAGFRNWNLTDPKLIPWGAQRAVL